MAVLALGGGGGRGGGALVSSPPTSPSTLDPGKSHMLRCGCKIPWVPNHALGCSIVERVPDLDSHASSLRRKAQDIKALPAAAAELPGTRHFSEHPSRSRRVHSWDWQAHRLLAQHRHAASWLWERASGATTAHRAGKGPVIRRFQDLFRAPGSAGGAGGCCAGGAGNAC